MKTKAKIARIRAKIAHCDDFEIDQSEQAIVEQKRDIWRRRIFALEHELDYANPFPNPVNEVLFRLWK